MTGFARAATADDKRSVKIEIRSVNHRYADIVLHMPKGYQGLEDKVRALVSRFVQRGRIEIFVWVEEFHGNERTVTLDQALLRGYMKAFTQAQQLTNQTDPLPLERLIDIPDLFRVEEEEVDAQAVWPLLNQALEEALRELQAMKEAEGRRLEDDISSRLRKVEQLIEEIQTRAPSVIAAYRDRLHQNIQRLAGGVTLDEERLAQEVAHFADKADISEELTRGLAHVAAMRETFATQGSVGRKLDFLLQELQREMNTTAAKANDAYLANLVVEAKAEIEKMREQVQNVE